RPDVGQQAAGADRRAGRQPASTGLDLGAGRHPRRALALRGKCRDQLRVHGSRHAVGHAAMKIAFPAQGVPIQKPSGEINPDWYGKLKALEDFVSLFSEVDPKAMTNGQVLIWNTTLKKFLPGAN